MNTVLLQGAAKSSIGINFTNQREAERCKPGTSEALKNALAVPAVEADGLLEGCRKGRPCPGQHGWRLTRKLGTDAGRGEAGGL